MMENKNKDNLQQRWYEEALTRANIVVFDQDTDLRYTRIFNPHPGFDAQAVLGRTDEELLPADDAAQLRSVKHSVLSTGKPAFINVRTTIGGEALFYTLSVSPKYDTMGNIIGIACTSVDITAVKRAELAHNESNAKMHEFLESIPDAFISIDHDWRYIYVNKKAEHILGSPREDIIGKDMRTEYAKGDKAVDRYQVVFDKRAPQTFEEYEEHLGKWFDTRAFPSRDGISIYLRDITERKEIELKLRESEERLRFSLESTHTGAWDIDLVDQTAFRSLEHDRIFGYQEILPQWTLDDFLHHALPEYREPVKKMVAEATAAHTGWTYECQIRRADGQIRWIWFTGNHRKDLTGRERVAGIVQDITERKKAEQALSESEERFRGLVLASSDVLYRMNADWSEMIQLNSSGFLEETLAPNPSWRLDYIHPMDLSRLNEAIDKAIRTKSVFELEHHVVRADGSLGWTFSRAIPMLDENGEITEWFGAASDITARKQAEFDLQESERKLKTLNENLEDLVVKRTEQVRSLSAALTFAEQRERKSFSYVLHEGLQQKLLGARLLLNQHTADHQKNNDDSGYEELDDGIALLNTAIQITRTLSLDLNPPILNTEGLDAALRWLCKHMQDNYKLNIDLQMHGPVDHIRSEAQMLLTNMIRELLSNVVRHSGVSRAKVTVLCENKQIKVIVKDKGKGFDVEKLFWKRPVETKFGLFSVRERLGLFGGQLQIESQIGHGTACTIIYPYSNC
jgi:PAS domain S-box-containing protein